VGYLPTLFFDLSAVNLLEDTVDNLLLSVIGYVVQKDCEMAK
jgi:hypothetical protein